MTRHSFLQRNIAICPLFDKYEEEDIKLLKVFPASALKFKTRMIVGYSENLSLISSRYIVWKYRDFLQLPCVLLPPLGTILATVIEVRKISIHGTK